MTRAGPGVGRAGPVALSAGLGDVSVDGDPVNDGGHETRVVDQSAPLIWTWHTFEDRHRSP